MRRHSAGSLFVVLFLSLSCSTAPAPRPILVTGAHQPDSGTLLVRCGHLLDGVSDEVRLDVELFIADGKIASIGKELTVPRGTPLLDLTGFTVLPGLIDAHTHLADRAGSAKDLSVYYRMTVEEQLEQSRMNATATLLAGFTSVRDLGTYIGWTDKLLRNEIDSGLVVGPRMQVAGFYLTVPGGGGDLLLPGFEEKHIPQRVRLGVARGADQFREKALAAVE